MCHESFCKGHSKRGIGGDARGQLPKSAATTVALESWIYSVAANRKVIHWKIAIGVE